MHDRRRAYSSEHILTSNMQMFGVGTVAGAAARRGYDTRVHARNFVDDPRAAQVGSSVDGKL